MTSQASRRSAPATITPHSENLRYTAPVDPALELPSWLAPAPLTPESASHSARSLKLANQRALYPSVFERALDEIAQGNPLSQAVEAYPVPISYTDLLAWIHRDEERQRRYYEAQAIGAEVVADQMIAISDAKDSVEDVQRSTLRINTRKWLLGVWNRKRYGDVKQQETTVTINLNEAMTEAQQRVQRGRGDVIDIEVKP